VKSIRTDSTLERIRPRFARLVTQGELLQADVMVVGKPLTPEEAIGTPGRRDFPIIVGKERVLEARVLGAKGQSFTDSPREFLGTIEQVLELELNTNQNRAIYIATLNAVLNHLQIVTGTVHCKDEEPERCALEIADHLLDKYGKKIEVGLIGLNPAIAERLFDTFGAGHLRITDLLEDNIGQQRFGTSIWDGNTQTEELIAASDILVITGTTLVNDTFDPIMNLVETHNRSYILYGMTAVGVAHLVDYDRICPYGHVE
jgi:uncharacterized protein (DUF4213/DUF364 family)